MRSGQETLNGIEEALRDVKAEEAGVQRELEAANRERATLAADRLEGLRMLATIRANDAIADGVIDEADNLSQQVRALLEARQRTIAQLRDRQSEAESRRAELVQRQDALNQSIAKLEGQLDHFAGEARRSLEGDDDYRAAKSEHAALAAVLAQAEGKARQAAKDEHEKGKPYRDDPLFMYLWQRRMGTSDYKATGLVRMLDGWVAGLARYSGARANYAMLTEIPVRLRAHADDLGRQTANAKQKVDDIEAGRTRELAGGDLIGQLQVARDDQGGLDNELEVITSELAETGLQLRTYAKGEDQSFQAAIASYAAFLERSSLRQLMADAMATPGVEDDRAVEHVRQLAARMEKLSEGDAARRRRLDQLSERKMELARLASNFRRQRYDDVGSQFSDNPSVEDLLQLLLRGAITAAEYWARMQSQQHWRNRDGDPWRRQSGLPPFDGFPGGFGNTGGFGRGSGWGSGGSRDSGGRASSDHDFETGGSF